MSDEAEKALAEIVAGLEGVTPGPWDYRETRFDPFEVFPTRDGPPDFGEWAAIVEICDQFNDDNPGVEEKANAAHISRCDPTTLRLIADGFTALKARIAELEGALEPFAAASLAFDKAAAHFNSDPPPDSGKPCTKFTHAQLRRARAALESKP